MKLKEFKYIVLVALVVMLVLLLALQWFYRLTSHEFRGSIIDITNSQIKVSGFHIVDQDYRKSDFSREVDVTVFLTVNTKFVKTVETWPTRVNQGSISSGFDPALIKKEQQVGSIDDLLKDSRGRQISIKTADNSINKSILTPTEIGYNTTIIPPPPLPATTP